MISGVIAMLPTSNDSSNTAGVVLQLPLQRVIVTAGDTYSRIHKLFSDIWAASFRQDEDKLYGDLITFQRIMTSITSSSSSNKNTW
jgi:hypothetical protein